MKIITNNKKVYHNFFVSEQVEAGIELMGCEVKSIRDNGISLVDSYVFIKNGEAFMRNCYIKPYDKATGTIPETTRTRKLLLHKAQIRKLERMTLEKGFSIVPTKVYLQGGKVKVEIGLAKGKKLYDKREALKDQAVKREIERTLKDFN